MGNRNCMTTEGELLRWIADNADPKAARWYCRLVRENPDLQHIVVQLIQEILAGGSTLDAFFVARMRVMRANNDVAIA